MHECWCWIIDKDCKVSCNYAPAFFDLILDSEIRLQVFDNCCLVSSYRNFSSVNSDRMNSIIERLTCLDVLGILDEKRKEKVLNLETKRINQFLSKCAQAPAPRAKRIGLEANFC